MNILVLNAHADDAVLGAGAYLIDHGEANIYWLNCTDCTNSLKKQGYTQDQFNAELKDALTGLNVKEMRNLNHPVRYLPQYRQEVLEEIYELCRRIQPDIVLSPSFKDRHQDHSTVGMEAVRASQGMNLLQYELHWNNQDFQPSFYHVFSDRTLDRKLGMVESFTSQMDKACMQSHHIRAWNSMRGVEVRSYFAEAYEVVRWVEKG